MNELQEFIQALCPDNVQRKTLVEIVKLYGGLTERKRMILSVRK